MSRSQHIIRKQTVNLRISRCDNALALQQCFGRMWEEQLLPRLEQVFDRLAGPDVWIELDKLEVDLGYVNPQAPVTEWTEKAFKAYTVAIETQLQKSSAVRRSGSAESAGDALAWFLERGYLPWWAAHYDPEAAVRKQLPALADKIAGLLASPSARRRWVRQFEENTQEALWQELARKRPATRPFSLAQWQAFFPELPGQQLRYMYWEAVWEAWLQPAGFQAAWVALLLRRTLAVRGGKVAQGKAEDQIFESLEGNLPLTLKQWQALFPSLSGRQAEKIFREVTWEALSGSGDFQRHWFVLLVRQALAVLSDEKADLQFRGAIHEYPGLSEKVKMQLLEALEQPGTSPLINETDEALPATSKHAPDEAGMFVPLAGIVLIHPFLPAFFQRLDLLDNEQFHDEAARERAVHLLYFLATGLQQPAEQETVLLKLLCGMEPEQPIEKELELGDTEKTEAGHLLEAVIKNWEAIAGSDPDDLRGSFFIRDGKLQAGDMGWRLTVEEKAYDILLTKLPWGLSPIMHSWMKGMIWVDWG